MLTRNESHFSKPLETTRLPLSLTSILSSFSTNNIQHKPNELYSDERRQYLCNDYPEAFCDFYGTPSGAPCLYRTGAPWSAPKPGPEMFRHRREMRPVHNHPIKPHWIGFLRSAETYLLSVDIRFNAIAGVAMSNKDRCMADEGTVGLFSPLVVLIGLAPCSVTFQEAKAAAEHIKNTILGGLGFGDVDVAIREWSTSLASRGPRLLSDFPQWGREDKTSIKPFTSILGLSVSSYAHPGYDGTGGLYLHRDDANHHDVILIAPAHVVRPPQEFPNTGTSYSPGQQRQDIVYLGDKAIARARRAVFDSIWMYDHVHIVRLKEEIESLSDKLEKGEGHKVPERLTNAQQAMEDMKKGIESMKQFESDVSEERLSLENRVIGHVLHADPIGPGPGNRTLDWAAIKLDEDMFDWENFQENTFFVCSREDSGFGFPSKFMSALFPLGSERPKRVPWKGVFQVSGVIPESELQNPTRKDADGNPCLPVLKSGIATGTTFGWLNGLETLVHYSMPGGVEYTAIETTFLPNNPDDKYSACAFSSDGDSGSTILDGHGRIVAMITGGSGSCVFDRHDLTYATPFHLLQQRIKEVLPGYSLYTDDGVERCDY
ncbi:hypothetical protein BKA70DRAFT_1559933 [Coprinopsis sp. MPI-PUGE-AT-0042]|nr:hypothetical protein BKA70DRAFT_1559933 [Coprinopsis sp. MPI-PUGE-AT-0042]